uniref:Uncharacterized protein n=1 Tax=Cajanus cajan TaxID=3821 RepID=A0A151S5H1_CAJCA|nr:hypothetical protein KK1_028241 [Cajanus cajan]
MILTKFQTQIKIFIDIMARNFLTKFWAIFSLQRALCTKVLAQTLLNKRGLLKGKTNIS